MSNNKPVTLGVHHVGFTVPDLKQAQEFFVHTLEFNVLGEVPDYPAVFLSDGSTMITLWQAVEPEKSIAFDRKNVIGLHHLAFTVGSNSELDNLHTRLQTTENVSIEFSPENLGDGPTRHFTISMPGGIRIEFIAPAA